MAYVQRCNVLIASPSDVADERNQIFRTIAEWNGRPGSIDGAIVFVPLMWEIHAISEANLGAQPAINKQLLERADWVLAVFRSRLGTETDDFPAGTVEELYRRKDRAAVFFQDAPRPDSDATEDTDQAERLRAFRQRFKGFPRIYNDPRELPDLVRQQLEGWSRELNEERCIPLSARKAPWKPDALLPFLKEQQDKPVNLLFFNIELGSFRSPDSFAQQWAFVNEFTCINRIVFLLPEYKVDRLKRLMPALVKGGQTALLNKFYLCRQKEGSTEGSARDRVSSSLAFVLACPGTDINTANCLSIADLAILSEPFSSANNYQDGSPDIQWDYNYYLSVDSESLVQKLSWIWYERYNPSLEKSLCDLIKTTKDDKRVDRALNEQRKSSFAVGTLRNDESYRLITQLRAKLFDPNVPSYLMNKVYQLLDWNPAFELVFPTNRFYRNMSVKEFVNYLDNCDDVKRRGLESMESDESLNMEEMRYTSPVYGNMRFTKIASRAIDPVTNEICGWIVALNVNHVEHWQVYEDDLKRTNEEQSLISLYALPAERILGSFPGYIGLVDAHAATMQQHGANRVLDLGAGLGFLTEKLLAAGMLVTSVDVNDSMIEITRRRCGAFPSFSAVKANVERLHAPNHFYAAKKVGIGRLYDGACMLNLYQWLRDPPNLLQRIVQDELLSPGAPITISLFCGQDEITPLFEALNHLQQVEQKRRAAQAETSDLWEQTDFERFSDVMQQFVSRGIAKCSPAVIEEHLEAAGYRLLEQRRVAYEIGGRQYPGFPFFVAEAPRG